MRLSPDAHQVRELVRRTFGEFDASQEDLDDLCENILIDDGRYVARSYRVGEMMAMWLVSVGLVQFYDADGNLLLTVNLFEQLHPQRMAA